MGSGGKVVAWWAAASVLAVVPGASLGQPAGAADGAMGALAKCASILDDAARLRCTDGVMRDAGMMPNTAARAEERRRRFGLARPPAPPKPAKVRAPAPALAQAAPKPKRVEKAAQATEAGKRIDVRLARVVDRGDGRLELVTTDGAVWRQVERGAIRPVPAAGGAMSVEKAALGSYLCATGKWVTFRCERLAPDRLGLAR